MDKKKAVTPRRDRELEGKNRRKKLCRRRGVRTTSYFSIAALQKGEIKRVYGPFACLAAPHGSLRSNTTIAATCNKTCCPLSQKTEEALRASSSALRQTTSYTYNTPQSIVQCPHEAYRDNPQADTGPNPRDRAGGIDAVFHRENQSGPHARQPPENQHAADGKNPRTNPNQRPLLFKTRLR